MSRTPDYYRQKAQESRTIAEDVENDEARVDLLDVAEQYEELARQAEIRREEGLA